MSYLQHTMPVVLPNDEPRGVEHTRTIERLSWAPCDFSNTIILRGRELTGEALVK